MSSILIECIIPTWLLLICSFDKNTVSMINIQKRPDWIIKYQQVCQNTLTKYFNIKWQQFILITYFVSSVLQISMWSAINWYKKYIHNLLHFYVAIWFSVEFIHLWIQYCPVVSWLSPNEYSSAVMLYYMVVIANTQSWFQAISWILWAKFMHKHSFSLYFCILLGIIIWFFAGLVGILVVCDDTFCYSCQEFRNIERTNKFRSKVFFATQFGNALLEQLYIWNSIQTSTSNTLGCEDF